MKPFNRRICLNRSVLDFMDNVLTPESIVIELGAGWSSLWFAKRCKELFTVETHPKWVKLIEKKLNATGLNNWTMIKCCLNMNQYQSKIENGYAHDYSTADLILIDCREDLRFVAAEAGWSLLKPGGWILFDDAQRPRHHETIKTLTLKAEMNPVRLIWQPGDIETARPRLTLAWQKKVTGFPES